MKSGMIYVAMWLAFANAPAHSQTAALPIVCKDLPIALNANIDNSKIKIKVTPQTLLGLCRSSIGLPLSLTTPTQTVVIDTNVKQARVIPFTVTDSRGNTATAKISVTLQ